MATFLSLRLHEGNEVLVARQVEGRLSSQKHDRRCHKEMLYSQVHLCFMR